MPDHKLIQKEDRPVVLDDFKKRIIDLMENSQALPDVDIYDEPLRYFKANEQWCSIIFGWLTWLEDVAGWQEAEDGNYSGIQQIIKFEEGIEPMATKDDIRDGMYEAFNRLAAQLLSGRYTDIVVGSDGTVSDPTSGSVEPDVPVEDDPTTTINETLAAKSGGCIAIRLYLQSICDATAAWWSASVIQADATTRLINIYGFDPTAAAAYTAYFYASAISPATAPILVEALSEQLFCRALSVETLFYYLYQLHPAANGNEKIELENLFLCITPGMISTWYEIGTAVPSTDYIAWPCTTIAIEEFDLNMSTANLVEYTTSGIWKKGHRFLIDITGTFTDSDNPGITYDGSYKIVTSTGIKTYWPIIFTGVSLPTNPDQDNIPYSASHIYSFTQDVPKTATNGTVKIGKDNGDFVLPNTTGILHFKVTDLGQHSV